MTDKQKEPEKALTITDRLSRLQKQLKAPKETNKNVSYKSRSAEQILEAAKECFLDGEYILLNDEIQYIGSRYYVKATATFGFGENTISCNGWANEEAGSSPIKGAQLTGACSSYARKYALGGLTALDDSRDDPDKQPDHDEKPKQADKPKAPELSAEEKLERNAAIERCKPIADALTMAKDIKQLDTVLKLQKEVIDLMPADLKKRLIDISDERRASLSPLNAG